MIDVFPQINKENVGAYIAEALVRFCDDPQVIKLTLDYIEQVKNPIAGITPEEEIEQLEKIAEDLRRYAEKAPSNDMIFKIANERHIQATKAEKEVNYKIFHPSCFLEVRYDPAGNQILNPLLIMNRSRIETGILESKFASMANKNLEDNNCFTLKFDEDATDESNIHLSLSFGVHESRAYFGLNQTGAMMEHETNFLTPNDRLFLIPEDVNVKFYPYRRAIVRDKYFDMWRSCKHGRDLEKLLAWKSNTRMDNHTCYALENSIGQKMYIMCSDMKICFGGSLEIIDR